MSLCLRFHRDGWDGEATRKSDLNVGNVGEELHPRDTGYVASGHRASAGVNARASLPYVVPWSRSFTSCLGRLESIGHKLDECFCTIAQLKHVATALSWAVLHKHSLSW